MSDNNVRQQCPTTMSENYVRQLCPKLCPTTMSDNYVRQQCPTTMSDNNVRQQCPKIMSDNYVRNYVRQLCPTTMSDNNVRLLTYKVDPWYDCFYSCGGFKDLGKTSILGQGLVGQIKEPPEGGGTQWEWFSVNSDDTVGSDAEVTSFAQADNESLTPSSHVSNHIRTYIGTYMVFRKQESPYVHFLASCPRRGKTAVRRFKRCFHLPFVGGVWLHVCTRLEFSGM
jgi:hypothetical protein